MFRVPFFKSMKNIVLLACCASYESFPASVSLNQAADTRKVSEGLKISTKQVCVLLLWSLLFFHINRGKVHFYTHYNSVSVFD